MEEKWHKSGDFKVWLWLEAPSTSEHIEYSRNAQSPTFSSPSDEQLQNFTSDNVQVQKFSIIVKKTTTKPATKSKVIKENPDVYELKSSCG